MTEVGRTDRHHTVYSSKDVPKLKTSAAATFALVFGLSALFSVLSLVLAPLALPFALIGLVLGLVGMRKARLPHVTGSGLAVTGLVMSVLTLLLIVAAAVGVFALKDNEAFIDELNQRIDSVSESVPTEVPSP